jgi:hypothetical protein
VLSVQLTRPYGNVGEHRAGLFLELERISFYQNTLFSLGMVTLRAVERSVRSQWPVIGLVTKIYYLELLSASEGTLSRWSRLHLQSLAPTLVFKEG